MDARAILAVGDLRLDPVRRQVTRMGRVIELGTREFSILEFLMRRPRETVTRTTIIEHVWAGTHRGPFTIVDVHIRRLRAKMDDHYPKKMILTVRGTGYKLVD